MGTVLPSLRIFTDSAADEANRGRKKKPTANAPIDRNHDFFIIPPFDATCPSGSRRCTRLIRLSILSVSEILYPIPALLYECRRSSVSDEVMCLNRSCAFIYFSKG
jgi:hypothetical protein